jgi:hypothetical protein
VWFLRNAWFVSALTGRSNSIAFTAYGTMFFVAKLRGIGFGFTVI